MAKRILKIGLIVIGVIVAIVLIYVAYVLLNYYRLDDALTLEVDAPIATALEADENPSADSVLNEATNGSGALPPEANSGTDSVNPSSNSASPSDQNGAQSTSDSDLSSTASSTSLKPDTEYTVVSANLGFGAYNQEFDFFMDGGSGSIAASPEIVREDIGGSAAAIQKLDPNFILFQEVDVDGTRSHHIDEYALLRNQFPHFWSVFCQNYDSPFLAWPLYAPHGANKAGLATFSDVPITSSLRRSLPISDSFSKFLDLDRCYDLCRIPAGDRELVLINVHLSAYGADADIMAAQRAQLYEDMVRERDAGNYVIAGGDFNHDMIGISGEIYGNKTQAVESWAKSYDFDGVPEGFTVASKAKLDVMGTGAFDDAATCRDAGRPYDGTNDRWIMDTFIYSDNVESLDYSTVDLDFAYSDHNPVMLRFSLAE